MSLSMDSKAERLSCILSSPSDLDRLKCYLQREHNSENLQFIEEYEKFKSSAFHLIERDRKICLNIREETSQDILKLARKLHLQFINPGSPTQINIS
eukprot:Pgem_evm1s9283